MRKHFPQPHVNSVFINCLWCGTSSKGFESLNKLCALSNYLPSQITQNDWKDVPSLCIKHVAFPLTDYVCTFDKYLIFYHRCYWLAKYEVKLWVSGSKLNSFFFPLKIWIMNKQFRKTTNSEILFWYDNAAAAASVVSKSVRPHRRQPTRLPHPWDSPAKNTGVGCHFLLQCMKVKSEGEVAQSCPTLCDPMDCSPPGSSGHGIFQARALEWGAIAFSVWYDNT